MEDELTPVRCGCGGEAIIIAEPRDGYTTYYCTCLECAINTDYQASEAEAIEAWNRAMGERTAKVKNITHVRGYPPEGECSNCGFDVIDDGEYCPGCGAKLDWSDHV